MQSQTMGLNCISEWKKIFKKFCQDIEICIFHILQERDAGQKIYNKVLWRYW